MWTLVLAIQLATGKLSLSQINGYSSAAACNDAGAKAVAVLKADRQRANAICIEVLR